MFDISHTPSEVFLRSVRLLPERHLPLLLRTGPDDFGLPVNHDVALGFVLDAAAVEFVVS